ncbi:hypothetical protein QP246_10725, partial [Aerococcus urinae]|nr:hypothetical protein [Aerococcus urinae]
HPAAVPVSYASTKASFIVHGMRGWQLRCLRHRWRLLRLLIVGQVYSLLPLGAGGSAEQT